MLTHKRQFSFMLILVLFASLMVAGIAAALASGPPQKDTYTNINAPDDNYSSDVNLWTTMSGDAGGNCTVTRIIFMEWSLADITDSNNIDNVILTVTRSAAVGSTGSFDVGVYESGDAADLNAITWNTQPTVGNLLDQRPFPGADGDQVQFQSPDLTSYVKNQAAGDQVLTLAFQLVPTGGSCPSGATTLVFDSIEDTAGTPPDIQILSPTAVTLSTLSANDSNSVNWAMIAGLFALGAVVIVGLGYGLRRSKQS